jgi:two-component system nitrate/nitrite response regulator NarL
LVSLMSNFRHPIKNCTPSDASEQLDHIDLSVATVMNKRRQRLLLVIADNHPVFLQGLANIFEPLPDIKIVAKCKDGLAALAAIREYAPDIAMVDISMPGFNGLDVLATVASEGLPTRVMFLTATVSGTQIKDAIAGGARGIVFKNSSPDEIARSVRKVGAGRYQFPKDLADAVRRRRAQGQKIQYWPGQRLTPREQEVTRLAIKGLSNREIGEQMQLTEGTVKIHLHNIYKKLNISNRTALAALMAGN